MIALYMALALACDFPPVHCLCPQDFVDKWWQVELSTGPTGNCYLFVSDGHIVEGNSADTWPIGRWELEYHGECQYSIVTDEVEIKVLGLQEGCLEVEYEGKEYSVCECQL